MFCSIFSLHYADGSLDSQGMAPCSHLLRRLGCASVFLTLLGWSALLADGNQTPVCAGQRPAFQPSQRPLPAANVYYVDTAKGVDGAAGNDKSPWKTIAFAMSQLRAGDTLCLRGGIYREQVRVSLSGRPDAPITIRSYPGEAAVIDGGFAGFFDAPADAWKPAEGGAAEEFVSTRKYPNERDIVGALGDSLVGLQTYWDLSDLRSSSELWDEDKTHDVKPVYCGPGVFYDSDTGLIHVRLSHTHLPAEYGGNYSGQTDPRKLPLVLAPFRSVPLHVDQGQYLRFQDLQIRGGGYDTVILSHASDIEFDNVLVHCGTYGLRAANTQHLKFYRSALYGNAAPWCFRTENSLRARKNGGRRDVARLTAHALLVIETGFEHDIYAYPPNDDWEISYSAFTDSHDGIYIGGIGIKFHHNIMEDMQDDGIYLSPIYAYTQGSELQIYQNRFTRCLTTLAFGGPVQDVKDKIFFYRNVVDLRQPVRYNRPGPTPAKPGALYCGNIMGDHGSPPRAAMNIYQNTFIIADSPRRSYMGLFDAVDPQRPRNVLNNILLTTGTLPTYSPMPDAGSLAGGNMYWGSNANDAMASTYFEKYRKSDDFKKSQAANHVGSSTKSIMARPTFVDLNAGDLRLRPDSAGVDAGAEVPADWPDPLRRTDAAQPDIGALPVGAEPFTAGPDAAR